MCLRNSSFFFFLTQFFVSPLAHETGDAIQILEENHSSARLENRQTYAMEFRNSNMNGSRKVRQYDLNFEQVNPGTVDERRRLTHILKRQTASAPSRDRLGLNLWGVDGHFP